MNKKIKSLDEVSDEVNEQLGVFKKFDRKSGFYISRRTYVHSSGRILYNKDYDLADGKVHCDLKTKTLHGNVITAFFKSKAGYSTKLINKNEHAGHYGEYISFLILKQLGKKVCKTDLGEVEIIFPFNNKPKTVEGSLSYPAYDELKGEMFREYSTIVDDYRLTYPKKYQALLGSADPRSNANINNVEVILKVLEEYCRKNGKEDQFPQIKKDFFDMMIFDLKFANRDRHDGNFGLKVSVDKGDIEFYPLFDNEQVLGLQYNKKGAEGAAQEDIFFNKLMNNDLTSYIGFPGTPQHAHFSKTFKYLLEHYYDETKDSLENIGRFTYSDLEEVLEVCPGLSESHKALAKKIFKTREKEMKEIVTEFEKNRKEELKEKNETTGSGPEL